MYRKERCQVPIFPRFWKCSVFATSCSILYVHMPVMVLLEIHTDCQTSSEVAKECPESHEDSQIPREKEGGTTNIVCVYIYIYGFPYRERWPRKKQKKNTSLCGVLVFGSVSRRPSAVRLPSSASTPSTSTQLVITQLVHTQLTHTQLVHTQLVHTQLVHTQLAHTPLVHAQLVHTQLTHTQLTHTQLVHTQLVHTQLTHTQLVHTQLVHTQLVPHTTCSHTTCPHTTGPHTTYSHTTCPHTTCPHTTYSHTTYSHTTYTSCIHRHFAWQAWHAGVALGDLLTHNLSTHNLHILHPPSLCVALGDIHLHFVWQAWHLVTSTFTVRGRRGTCWHGPSLCVAGVALGDIHLHFVWQAWHLWHWAGSGGALGSRLAPWAPRLFAWQAWHLATWTFILRGRRGTWWHPPSLCVAGVALMALGWLWWRAWFPFGAVGAAAVCVAGVILGHINFHFAWQAWHVWHRAGRRGTWRHVAALCVAGVALWDIHLRFTLQAWYLDTEPPGVTFMPSSAGTIRVSLKLLWATSACCVPRGSLQRRCRCHMPLGFISQKCNWRRLSGLWPSAVVRSCPWCSMWLFPCLGLDPDSVCSIYRL